MTILVMERHNMYVLMPTRTGCEWGPERENKGIATTKYYATPN